jgi:hypothetical protein
MQYLAALGAQEKKVGGESGGAKRSANGRVDTTRVKKGWGERTKEKEWSTR